VLPMFFDVTKYMLLSRGRGEKGGRDFPQVASPELASASELGEGQ
jgi:hypothetical protein